MLDETDVRAGAVPPQTVRDLARVLAPLGEPARVELLTGGTFATTYRVTLTDGTRVVVKTAPAGDDRLLRYELDLVRTEAQVYGLGAARPDLLMPRVLLTDFTRTVLPTDVLVVSHLDGVPLVDLGALAPGAQAHVDHQLGAFMARMHTVTGERFGYLNAACGLHAPTWPDAFGLMLGALLDDAARWATPVPAAEARAALARHTDALAEVTVPALVHGDLWAGNLFVEPSTHDLVGVIDTERSMWGDPLFDLVGADQMGVRTAPADLRAGYAAAGGTLALGTPGGDVRLELYRLYLSLVLLIEITPRGFTGDWLVEHRATAQRLVRESLDVLLGR